MLRKPLISMLRDKHHKPHINKKLRKTIVKRSQLKNKAGILKYQKQRNYMVKLDNQAKQYSHSLNTFLDSKPFWKSCKPYCSNKHLFGDSKIALNENGEILIENIKMAKAFNSYFESITDSLGQFDWPLLSNISDGKVQDIFKVFSIKNIKFPDSLKLSDIISVYKKLDDPVINAIID